MTILISTFVPASPLVGASFSSDFTGDGTSGNPLALVNPVTAAEVALISTALQPGDNISDLINDNNYQSDTQVNATVSTAINNLINSAPGTLDTLGELAVALQDNDSDIAAIVSVNTSQNASIAANTAAISSNDSDIATNASDIDALELVSHPAVTIAAASASALSLSTQELSLDAVDINLIDNINTSAGSIIASDGAGGATSSELVRVNDLGCSLLIQDDTGLDFCNWQIGTSGSAFTVLKKSLGTIAAPTAITDGTKIGGWGFIGDDGVSGNPGIVGAELQAFAIGDHDATNSGTEVRLLATPQGSKTPNQVLRTNNNTDIILPQYPPSRNDVGSPQSILYTDSTGLLYARQPRQVFYIERSVIESTNGTLADYINTTIPIAVPGQYEIEYNVTLRMSSTTNNYRVGVFVGGQSIANYGGDGFISMEAKDSGADVRIALNFKRVITLGFGTTPILMQYQRQTTGVLTIYDANIIIKEFI